jgi:hypothetical protein
VDADSPPHPAAAGWLTSPADITKSYAVDISMISRLEA